MEAEKVVTRIVPAPVRVSVYYFVRGVILLDKGTGWVGASACRVSPPPFLASGDGREGLCFYADLYSLELVLC